MSSNVNSDVQEVISGTLQEAFEQAVAKNDELVVKVMLSAHGNKQILMLDKALCDCAEKGYTNILKLLLSNTPPPDVRYSDEKGRRALHYAAYNGSLENVQLLLGYGAAINWADKEGFYALHFACQNGYPEVAALLISRGAHMSSARSYKTGETPMHVAAGAGNIEILEVLLRSGANIDGKTTLGKGGYTALHKSAMCGKIESAQFLCKNRAMVDITDMDGKTPLHVAADQGNSDIVRILIENGADLSIRCKKGKTPLFYAIYSKNPIAMEFLVEFGPDTLAIPDGDGYFPLHCAILTRNESAAQNMVRAGADVNARVIDKFETPLHHAASMGSLDMIQCLLNNGADVNAQDKHGTTPLHRVQTYVPGSGRTNEIRDSIVYELLRSGACINALDNRGFSPLLRCVFAGHLHRYTNSTFKMLVQHGASLKSEPHIETGGTPHSLLVWLAWYSDNLELADYLVRAGWDITNEHWINLRGKTDQHEAFHQKMRDLLKFPKNLQHSCRIFIREYLSELTGGQEILSLISQLPLPPRIIEYLSLFNE